MNGGSDGAVRLRSYPSRSEHLVVGLMSGTSLDGVDAVLVRIGSRADGSLDTVTLVHHSYLPYSSEFRALVASLCSVESARIDDLVYVHYGLGEWYARAVQLVLTESRTAPDAVDAVSMHGQTVWHAPTPRTLPGPDGLVAVKGTLQLGAAAVVRERTGIPVVWDFRARDMAAGGEGAPLAPYIDALLFGSGTEGRIVQNIGGIGNATVIPAGGAGPEIVAFDTGPGNMVIDAIVRLGTGGREAFDAGGARAAAGRVDAAMVESLMKDPYFSRRPPKSTGREVYGTAFAEELRSAAAARHLSLDDAVATATAFTAESIARAYRDFVLPTVSIATVLVCGGGARNATLLRMIGERLPAGITVTTISAHGVPDEAREAMAFAVMGHESLMGRPGNLPSVTGARAPVVLGSVTL
ncbi:MAG TPA: anhydro-N-acetylmuramic acid kinase [Spirochaetia bacterium]